MAGYSAQIFNPTHSGYFNHEVTSQDIPNSSRPLNDFSISHSSCTTNELEFTDSSQDVLDETVLCDFANEPVDDDFTLTDLTSTNSHQIAQQLPSGHSSVTFSQPSSRPVAIVTLSHENAQQQLQTKAKSANPSLASGIDKAAKANEQSPAGKAAKYKLTPAGKAAKAKYEQSYEQSLAGKATKTKYRQSPLARQLKTSAMQKIMLTGKS